MEKTKWNETVIVVQADYADRLAFDLTVNFERMLGRRIPKADLAQWLVCLALDGGLTAGQNTVNAVLIHNGENDRMENFSPACYGEEIDGKAFSDPHLGEFLLNALPVEKLVERRDFFEQVIETLANAAEVKRLIVVPEAEDISSLASILSHAGGKEVTLLGMEPLNLRGVRHEIVGYSLMSALGIRGEELR
ncbi:MAG: hypothetical protein NC388_03655 [Clostridium sp.]|nr:hypothetical protein [Clostridium sp.]